MRLLLISDAYPPSRLSSSGQMADLSVEFARLGHETVVVTPRLAGLPSVVSTENLEIVRFPCPEFRAGGKVKRALFEATMPILAFWSLLRWGILKRKIDAVVVYSPSIFWSLLVYLINRQQRTFVFLILRDIFPDWMLDLGLIRKGVAFNLLNKFAKFLYDNSDIIAVQSPSNKQLVVAKDPSYTKKLRVLFNWQSPQKEDEHLLPRLEDLVSKRVIVYAGNLGLAQAPDVLIDVASLLADKGDLCFLLIGRGSEKRRLVEKVESLGLSNVKFAEEIPQQSLSSLLKKCFLGLIALDHRHKAHNIPGKFLSYLINDLPVIAIISKENDLANLIIEHNVGEVFDPCEGPELVAAKIFELLSDTESYSSMKAKCRPLMNSTFSTERAAKIIIEECSKQRKCHVDR